MSVPYALETSIVEARKRDWDEPFVAAMNEILEERKLNYSDVARATGHPGEGHAPTQVRRWLTAERRLPHSFVIEFCEALELPLDYVHRKAGFVPKVDVSAVIDGDPDIDEVWKEMLKVTVETARRNTQERRTDLGRRLR